MGERLPSFSIVVPTYRRPRQIAACLDALAGLDYPPELVEVIVVDSNPDPTDATIPSIQNELRLQVLRQPPGGQAAARNLGADAARGEFLAFTDDDCRPATNWLRALAAQFDATPDRAIGGPVRNALTADPYATVTQMVIDCLYAWYNRAPSAARYFGTNNLAVPAPQFRALGGFDACFRPAGEDRDFCARWIEQGNRMTFVPEAIVWHAHDLTLAAFWQQHFNYGRGSFRFHFGKDRKTPRAFPLESFRFYWKLLTAPLSPAHRTGHSTVWLSFLLLVSQAATAAGFARQAVQRVKASQTRVPAPS